jgi:plastocyanin
MLDRPRGWTLVAAALFAAVLVANACGGGSSGPSGGNPDSGQPDSGQPDSGGPDSGTPDGGDGGPDGGTDGGSDGGATSSVNGCTSFTDATAAGASRVINRAGFTFSPNCLLIAAGQSVTWNVEFTVHPLRPGAAPSLTTSAASTEPTPIEARGNGTSVTFTFPTAGTYGFYCNVHEPSGMYGAIKVQ